MILSSYSFISTQNLFSEQAVSILLLVFVNFSLLAFAHGYTKSHYPLATITLENNKKISGKILKFGEYVYLLKKDEPKKIFINKDKIVSIEEYLQEPEKSD